MCGAGGGGSGGDGVGDSGAVGNSDAHTGPDSAGVNSAPDGSPPWSTWTSIVDQIKAGSAPAAPAAPAPSPAMQLMQVRPGPDLFAPVGSPVSLAPKTTIFRGGSSAPFVQSPFGKSVSEIG